MGRAERLARCVSCGRRALALDCYCAPCLDRLHAALAELLAWSEATTWRTSPYWWRAYRMAMAMMRGEHDAA
jgi:hypothetical protein